FEAKTFSHWKKYNSYAGEVKISDKSRVDMVLWKSSESQPQKMRPQFPFDKKNSFHFVEVKNVTLAEKEIAQFPDAISERALKHIEELLELMKEGHTAELLFVVQREDCEVFKPADHIDPKYGNALRKAQQKGLQITAAICSLKPEKIALTPKTLSLEF
ncbi:MAG: DNA/RNA nuclease SfsA, partial [Pseudobdellovibrionaceae bacterium]